MNLIYDEYPNTVILGSTKREIVTDFKDWLRFVDMLKDEELRADEKFDLMLLFYREKVPMEDWRMAHKPLEGFFRMEEAIYQDLEGAQGENENGYTEPGPCKPMYDFSFDARYIIAAFWHDYRIDLTTAHMHWWKFLILLDGLSSDTEFKQRIMYRSTDASRIKDTNERNRILRIQRKIAVPAPRPTDFEIGDAFF